MKKSTNFYDHSLNGSALTKTSNTIKSLIICTLLLMATKAMAQTTHIVNNNAGTEADFTELQAAIDAAANGDIIHVQQSPTAYGNIVLNKELTIIGRSHSDVFYKSVVGSITFADGASNSTLKGLKTGGISDEYAPTPLTINNLAVLDCDIPSIDIGIYQNYNNVLFQGNIIGGGLTIRANTSNVLIANNIIQSSSLNFMMVDTLLLTNNIFSLYYGVTISNSTTGLLNISNCIFVADYTSTANITLSGASGGFQVNNCVTYNYEASNAYNFQTGTNISLINVQENVDPLFTNRVGGSGSIASTTFTPGIDDLTLQASSPVVDEGLYEGYNFKPLGTPTGVPSIKIDNYSPTVPKNGDLNVTITAKTN